MKRVFLVFSRLLLVFVCASHWAASAQSSIDKVGAVPRFEPAAGKHFPISIPKRFGATTGYLWVKEDRSVKNGKTIRLPIAIVHAQTNPSKSSPVLYLGGGPGSSALNVAAYPGAYPFLKDRDFVVMEQRGTKYAEPALGCPEYAGLVEETEQINAVKQCKERIASLDIDAAAYSTAAIAADIEDLRRALGVDKWILYGVSYGTRVALSVMRDNPDSVEAALLDSVLPPQVRYDDESTANLQAAIELVLRDCAASQACNDAFPHLKQRFYDTLERISEEPVVVNIAEHGNEKETAIRVLDLTALLSTASPREIANTPRTLDAIARMDSAILQRAAETRGSSSRFSWGMRLSVWCSESLPFSERVNRQQPLDTLGGLESAVVLPAVCNVWDVPKRPVSETEPVQSNIPTLLVAGEYDPATPPKWAYEAADSLPKSRVVVIRGEGHAPIQNWSGDGCAMAVALAFIDAPEQIIKSDTPLPECLTEQTAPSFITTPYSR